MVLSHPYHYHTAGPNRQDAKRATKKIAIAIYFSLVKLHFTEKTDNEMNSCYTHLHLFTKKETCSDKSKKVDKSRNIKCEIKNIHIF